MWPETASEGRLIYWILTNDGFCGRETHRVNLPTKKVMAKEHQHSSGFSVQPWGRINILIKVESSITCEPCHPSEQVKNKGVQYGNLFIHPCACIILSHVILYLALYKKVPYTSGKVLVLQLWIYIRYVLTDSSKLQHMASIQVPENKK